MEVPFVVPSRWFAPAAGVGLALLVACYGCHSPYRSDQGALFGGLLGAGTGAIVGEALGNPGAGAAIGAGVGALSGAAVGSELDEIEAQNRAMIEAQLGRQLAAGAVQLDDVVAMAQAGVDDQLIINHIRAHGMAAPLSASDIILLKQQGVSSQVIPWWYGPPCWHGHWHYHHRRARPGFSWGIAVHN